MHRLNQITEHAISEFQRLRIDALEKETTKLEANNIELTNANKLAHERIKELQDSIDTEHAKNTAAYVCNEALEKENISLHNAKQTLLSKCSELEQQRNELIDKNSKLQDSIDTVISYRDEATKKRKELQAMYDKLEQQVANIKRDLVSKQTR